MPMLSRLMIVFPLLGLGCQGDLGLSVRNTVPTVSWLSPDDQTIWAEGATLHLAVIASDEQTPADQLEYIFSSDVAGDLSGTLIRNLEGAALEVTAGLTAGTHELVVTVIDPLGMTARDSISLKITPNTAPMVTIDNPTNGAEFVAGWPTEIAATVVDVDQSDLSTMFLSAVGVSTVVGNLPASPDSNGEVVWMTSALTVGSYALSLTALDELGATGSATIVFSAIDGDLDNDTYVDLALGGDDCNDLNPVVHPGANEYCNGYDDDCDSQIDESDALDVSLFFGDGDGDDFGDPTVMQWACTAPASMVANADDCDDTDDNIHPAAIEICDGQDNNCDGEIDEDSAANAVHWFFDSDRDAYGVVSKDRYACDDPGAKWVDDDTDCDDTDEEVHPQADEYCNGYDDDCDGAVDESDALDVATFFGDDDGDSYGDVTASLVACDMPEGMVTDNTDCDDSQLKVNPGYGEVCDGLDNNCDGQVDNNASDTQTFYADEDGDSYGNKKKTNSACVADFGWVKNKKDCDDTSPLIKPGGVEVCDSVDNDCDSQIDEEDALGQQRWYLDADGDGADGYGDASDYIEDCDPVVGRVENDLDCDPSNGEVYPGAIELCNDIDDDCDGEIDEIGAADGDVYYPDVDGDLFGDPLGEERYCDDPGDGFVDEGADCDDLETSANPNAIEQCDYLDNDCDGLIDEGCERWFKNHDNKLFGVTSGGHAGMAVANAGDVDGDSIDDLLVGAPAGDGVAYLIYSSVDGSVPLWEAQLQVTAPKSASLGSALAGGVDWTGDGVNDIAIGAPKSGVGGAVYLLSASATGELDADQDAQAILTTSKVGARLGDGAMLPALFYGDGEADLVLGSWAESSGAGAVYFISGPIDADAEDAGFRIAGPATGSFFGHHGAVAGDLDGDGGDDVVIGL
ncbi:MAG: hypothetical protein HN348_10300, partial [Proteobacteria bacterium]|nr:hypothetical protein [Pseudomonadota bacterium]